jgi:hypothetical protein
MFRLSLAKCSLSAGVVFAAASLPAAAQARLDLNPLGQSEVSAPARVVSVQAPPSTAASASSFEWGDAAIGAAGPVVLLGAGAVAAGGARRRRGQRQLAG